MHFTSRIFNSQQAFHGLYYVWLVDLALCARHSCSLCFALQLYLFLVFAIALYVFSYLLRCSLHTLLLVSCFLCSWLLAPLRALSFLDAPGMLVWLALMLFELLVHWWFWHSCCLHSGTSLLLLTLLCIHTTMMHGSNCRAKHPSFKYRASMITPREELLTTTMQEVVASKAFKSVGDSSSTPTHFLVPSESIHVETNAY